MILRKLRGLGAKQIFLHKKSKHTMKKRKKDPEIPLAMIICKNPLKKKQRLSDLAKVTGAWSKTGGAGDPQPDNREFKVKTIARKDKKQRQKRLRKTRCKDKKD